MSSDRRRSSAGTTAPPSVDGAVSQTMLAPRPERKHPLALAITLVVYAAWMGFLAWLAWQSMG